MLRGSPLVERENNMEAPGYVEEDERIEADLRDGEQQVPLQEPTENETVIGGAQPIFEIDRGKEESLDKGSALEEMDETVLELLQEIATQCTVSFNQHTEQDRRDAVNQVTLQESTENEAVKVGSQPIHRIDSEKQQNFEKGNAEEHRDECFNQIVDEIAKLCNGVISNNQRTEPDLRDPEQKAPLQDTTEDVETVTVLSQPIHESGCGENQSLENESVAGEMDEEDGLGTVQDEGIVFKRLEEANIQVLREKADNFSQQVFKLLHASKAHILDELNVFKEEIMQFHQKVLEIFEAEIELGIRNVDTANEDRLSFHLGKARNVLTGLQVSASPDHV